MRIVLFLYQWLVFLPVFIVVTVFTALTTIIGSFLFGNRFWGFYPARLWSIITCYLAFCPVKVEGRYNLMKSHSYIFVANHQGAFDIFLIYGFLNHNFRWIMKQELRSLPFVGAACASAGHIFVDRSNPKSIKESLENARKQLSGGLSVVVFPEGSRTQTGKIGRFKKGAFQLATDLNLPIVPISIDGPFRIMPRGAHTLRPMHLKLVIHEPISTDDLSVDDIPSLMEKCHSVISLGLK
ncbi:lysophospholipid acyltransferase family protein [Parabacteroides sp. FAFU027]|uniref:lysophospholipid acyltransferase family protein n=1 Tax=Parabacteroides sp. FAFU027 TaxID=2922715 RepID=UPI00397DC519